MSNNTSGATFIELTATIVSAYVSNNSVPASDLPALIDQVHTALTRVLAGRGKAPAEPPKTGSLGQEIDHRVRLRLPLGRKKIQVAQAPPTRPIRQDPGAISGKVGVGGGLPNGRAELCGSPLPPCQANGARPATPAAQITDDAGSRAARA
jgi:hypothetical protein